LSRFDDGADRIDFYGREHRGGAENGRIALWFRQHGEVALKTIVLAVPFILIAWATSADQLYDKCMDAADGTNPAFGKCGGDWIARADAAMNAAWKNLYTGASENSKKDLLAEQRLWNAYKEKSCEFLDNGDFGREGQVIHFPACRARIIEARTKQLKDYASPNE